MRRLVASVAAGFVVAGLVTCDRVCDAAAPPRTISLAYTAELRGNLLPCSCPARPLGGLSRRIGFVDSLRTGCSEPLFVLDAGSSADLPQVYPGMPLSEQDGIARLIKAGDQAIAYDARAGGVDDEARLGPNGARKVLRDGIRLGVVAVDETVDPRPAAAAVRDLGRVDLVVVLCSGDFNFATTAASLIHPDIVIVARGATYPEPIIQGGIIYLGPGVDGKYVGFARVRLGKPARTIEARLRAMDASVVSSPVWDARVETALVGVEARHPGALARGE